MGLLIRIFFQNSFLLHTILKIYLKCIGNSKEMKRFLQLFVCKLHQILKFEI